MFVSDSYENRPMLSDFRLNLSTMFTGFCQSVFDHQKVVGLTIVKTSPYVAAHYLITTYPQTRECSPFSTTNLRQAYVWAKAESRVRFAGSAADKIGVTY
jgi:hypothetical protein